MKRKPRETDEQFLERVARVRGAMEERFWRQAADLKAQVERFRPERALEKLRIKMAKAALRRANLAYLDEDLEGALKSQAKVKGILFRIRKNAQHLNV